MLDIDEFIIRLIEHPAKELFYSISESKILDRKVSDKEYDENDDLCSFCGAKKCWDTARKTFARKHPDAFAEVLKTCSVAKWNFLVKEAHLEKEWFLELRLALAENITQFTELFGLIEVEPDPEIYREIKKELLIFESKHYEKKYSDTVFFRLGADYEVVPMTILGKSAGIHGVSFYPSDNYGDNFLLEQNQDRLRIDPAMTNSIIKVLTFYFEKGTYDFDDLKDTYESHNHFTSTYLSYGTLMRSYLPKSIALRALNYLRCANRELASFTKTKQSKIKDNQFYDIVLDDGKYNVYECDVYKAFDGNLPYDFDNVCFGDTILKTKKSGAFDATVRCIPSLSAAAEEDERIINLGFVALLCDHETGYVHISRLGQAKNFHPFDNLSDLLTEDLQKITVPKTIYVNNYFDSAFFSSFFEFFIDRREIRIAPTSEKLQSDFAFESLEKFVNDEMEDNDGVFSGKTVGEA